LGNTRVTFQDANDNGFVESSEIVQRNHYYPFGMDMEGPWNGSSSPTTKYKYNNKEWNNDYGLGMYDYGARYYDPAVGRWTTPDPLADSYDDVSPYNYVLNGPINRTDPDGREPEGGPVNPIAILQSAGAFISVIANAVGSNLMLGAGRQDPNSFVGHEEAAAAGQKVGDAISVVAGAIETAAGGGATVAASPATGGSSLVLTPATTAVAVHGIAVTTVASKNLTNPTKVDAKQTGEGRGSNNRKPDSEATGDHSVSNKNGSTTYTKNDKNPTGFQEVKRVDKNGASHNGVKTPHVHENKNVRPAKPFEVPKADLSKNKKP
jgi:RHS repeat-associated protein